MRNVLLLVMLLLAMEINAQSASDSVTLVTVKAFLSDKQWKDVPAAISVISTKELQNISTTSLLPSFNSITGVRMEERSPGSYRLSIRGSTLRSPFGVRNVKIYWNDIPLTDGGGNTYLNLVDINGLSGAEIIKGPAASVYGAGTGGAVLLRSALRTSEKKLDQYSATVDGGSFGLLNGATDWKHLERNFSTNIQLSHLQSDGYRQQSALRKDIIKWDGNLQVKEGQFNFLCFYTDLYYQTPGGLTKAQILQDPKLARPAAGAIPGAIQQHSAIYNKTLFGGLNYQYKINASLTSETSLMLNHTSFTNPFITNYENRDETNTGLRTKFNWHHEFEGLDLNLATGGEWLYNHARIDDYGNKNGMADTLQLKDDLYANQWFVFSQLQISYKKISLNAGLSLNDQSLHYKRLTDPAMQDYLNTNNENVLAPRIALLYKVDQNISLYSIAAKGFSPPTLAEVHPQDRLFHSELQPEYGWNLEAGLKGGCWSNRLQFDLAVYDFELKQAIVIRTNTQGAQYFVNAGTASEKGMELWLKYRLLNNTRQFLKTLNIWSSYSYQPYYFSSYIQSNNNYSGNAVTGVPKNNWVIGADLETKNNYYLNIQYDLVSSIPLDDANDEFADSYHLLQVKLGRHFNWNKFELHVFAGADNLLNEVYSLGNDINAAARRFYNPAPGRNFYGGLSIRF